VNWKESGRKGTLTISDSFPAITRGMRKLLKSQVMVATVQTEV